MKVIKNISMQGLSIPFATPDGVKSFFLTPKQQVEVPDKWKSKVAENLVHRRMVKMTYVAEPAPVQTPTKKTRKSN
jgi:hypothetical protein